MTVHAAHNAHKEQVLQDHLIDRLVSGEGYERRKSHAGPDAADAENKIETASSTCRTSARCWMPSAPDAPAAPIQVSCSPLGPPLTWPRLGQRAAIERITGLAAEASRA